MSFPIGTAVCAYTFWFLFSEPGKSLYDRPRYALPPALSELAHQHNTVGTREAVCSTNDSARLALNPQEQKLVSELIGVVGAGTMGNGIAQVAARAGYDVVMRDVRDEFLERGMSAIDKSLQRDVDKERFGCRREAGNCRSNQDHYCTRCPEGCDISCRSHNRRSGSQVEVFSKSLIRLRRRLLSSRPTPLRFR